MNSNPSPKPLLRTGAGSTASRPSTGTPPSVWLLRIALAAVPLVVGPVVSSAFEGQNDSFRFTAVALVWLVWIVMIGAAAVPRPIGLTAIRIGLPGLAVAAIIAAASDDGSALGPIGIGLTLISLFAGLFPATVDHFVDGGSYGDERRFALRMPLALLLGPFPLAAALTLVGFVAGPLLLADRRWVLGAIALVVGWPVAAILVRSIHGLASRWLVYVPAGLTIVDHSSLAVPVHLPRGSIVRFGPAPIDTDAFDLTGRSTGLVLEATLEPAARIETRSGRATTDGVAVDALLVNPLRPGVVLEEARRRRIAVG